MQSANLLAAHSEHSAPKAEDKNKQESLANAEISARQYYVYEGP